MSKKLLLADDSVTIQKVIEITFANEDYDLTIVGNGDEAFEQAKLNSPDLILADIIMPGKNGYELCSEIKQTPELAQTPVLLLAGSFEPFDEEKARKVGADSWIAKPFESYALIEKVKNLLENPPQAIQPPIVAASPFPDENGESFEESAAMEDSVSLDQPDSEETLSAEHTSEHAGEAEEFAGGEEEPASETTFIEPEDGSMTEPLPDIMGTSSADLEDTVHSQPSSEAEMVPRDELEDTETIQDSSEKAESASMEFEPSTSGEPLSEATEFSSSDVEEDDEEILLLGEDDIFVEEETLSSADSDYFGDQDAVAAEGALSEELSSASGKEEFFESLPESSFEFDSGTEDLAGEEEFDAEEEKETAEFSFAEEDQDSSSSAENIEGLSSSAIAGEEDEGKPEMEFSFDDFEDNDTEETEISAAVPEESAAQDSSVTFPPAEQKTVTPGPANTYAQMEQKVHSLTDAQLYSIVEKVAGATIERMAREILEQVAWEVVPNLSENIIKEEIEKIKIAQ